MRTARLGIAALMASFLVACSGTADPGGAAPGPVSTTAPASPDFTGGTGKGGRPSPAVPPVAGAAALPATGQCWSLTAEELDEGAAAVSTAPAATDCAGEHNAITVAVAGISDEQAELLGPVVGAGAALDPDHEAIWRTAAGAACTAAYAAAFTAAAVELPHDEVAFAYRSSTLHGVGWLPTAADWQAGARWIRCDIANRTAAPIPFTEPVIELATIPQELVECLAAGAEGTFPVPCGDPLANAQALVTITLTPDATAAAKSDYEKLKTTATTVCQDAVGLAFPDSGKPGMAALPIEFAFDGTFDCYVERAADEPLVTG